MKNKKTNTLKSGETAQRDWRAVKNTAVDNCTAVTLLGSTRLPGWVPELLKTGYFLLHCEVDSLNVFIVPTYPLFQATTSNNNNNK